MVLLWSTNPRQGLLQVMHCFYILMNSPFMQLEPSSSSFTALMANAPTGEAAYIDSGDIFEESIRRAGGMKIRMQHYFKRQA